MPVHVGVQWSTQAAARECPRGDIQLAFCPRCGLISNTAFEPQRLDYDHSYENSLDLSPLYHEYVLTLAKRLIESYDLHKTTLIEVGCGHGDFLRLMCELGDNDGIGFDPSCDRRSVRHGHNGRIRFVPDCYSDRYAEYQGRFLCCRQVFEHVADPGAFLDVLRRAIRPNTTSVVYFEVPSAHYLLRHLALWTIIYEHCSYFAPEALGYLFASHGFSILDLYESYKAQFLGLEAFPSRGPTCPTNGKYRQDVRTTRELIDSFSQRCEKKIEAWRSQIGKMERNRWRVVLWGAGARAVSFTNILGVTDSIPYVVDINPHKIGKCISGTGQPIVSPAFLEDYRPDVIVIMNDIYESEIRQTVEPLGLTVQYLVA